MLINPILFCFSRCGKLSDKCEQFMVEESCFYECDKNMGKWRKHADCTQPNGDDNGWQIKDMPIKVGSCRLTLD